MVDVLVCGIILEFLLCKQQSLPMVGYISPFLEYLIIMLKSMSRYFVAFIHIECISEL